VQPPRVRDCLVLIKDFANLTETQPQIHLGKSLGLDRKGKRDLDLSSTGIATSTSSTEVNIIEHKLKDKAVRT
jgi:hypothetical protein